MKLAFVYDRINKFGGAERILTAFHQAYPEAPFYTAVFKPQSVPWAKTFSITTSFLNRWPLAKTYHELYPWLTPLAFESFNFNQYDVVISITSAEAKAIITPPSALHLCYCLTPTRYLWSHSADYQQNPGLGKFNPAGKFIFKLLKPKLQQIDLINSVRPDAYIAISKTVQARIKKYYHRNSLVIYPPVATDKFSYQTPHDYFLLVSRLVPYKQVDLVIKTFNRLKLNLIIVGTGREETRLKKMAKANIKFAGQVSESELIIYYQNCLALIMPQEEDFGLVSLEAQAAGKPVIAYRAGGAVETIVEFKTGLFFNQPTVDSLAGCVKQFNSRSWDHKLIRSQAEKFSSSKFIAKFKNYLEAQWQQHQEKFR
ncbi:MAG: glycosyltransferase [Candidatus Beckwithbacteria bacterium]